MLVRMRTEMSGLRDGKPWPPVGGTVDLPDDEALTLCRNGVATPAVDVADGVEHAVLPAPEARDALVKQPRPSRKK